MNKSRNARIRAQLARDQNGRCFYCHLYLRDDNTLEHLLAKKLGGLDNYGNLRAAHSKCNGLVGHLPVDEKLRLAKIGRENGSDAFFLEMNEIHKKRSVAARAKAEKRRFKSMRRKWARTVARLASETSLLPGGAGTARPSGQAVSGPPVDARQNAKERGGTTGTAPPC